MTKAQDFEGKCLTEVKGNDLEKGVSSERIRQDLRGSSFKVNFRSS